MSPRTLITWRYGDATLQVSTGERLTPEGIETVTHRSGAEFVERYRELADEARTIDGNLILPPIDNDADQEAGHE